MADTLNAFDGDAIYLDTMVPYMLLRGIDAAAPFFERLERGELRVFTSVLTFDELGYRLLLAFIKDKYSGSPLDRLRDEEEKMLIEFGAPATSLLQRLRAFTFLTVLDALTQDLDTLGEAMTQFHLRPRDALHYAAMQRVGCFDLASNDAHFDRVPTIKRYTL